MLGLNKQMVILGEAPFFFRGRSASRLSLGAQKSAPNILIENDWVERKIQGVMKWTPER